MLYDEMLYDEMLYDEWRVAMLEQCDKLPDRPTFSCPDDWKFTGHEWWCAAAGKRNEMKWGKKSEKCICHSESEKAKAQASGLLTRENYDKAIGRSTYKYNPSDPDLLDFIEELGLDKQEIADAFKTSLTAAEKEIWEKQ